MRLTHFSVESYRSIVKAHQLRLDTPVTVLIGPNNEGKSNILRALVTAMTALPRMETRSPRRLFRGDYDWERDFPIHLQDEQQGRVSVFRLAFNLSRAERKQFENAVKCNLVGDIILEFRVGKSECEISVADSHPNNALTKDFLQPVCEFLAKKFTCQYIPSVRNAESAQKIVETIVERQLAAFESNREYRAAIAQIERIQRPVLAGISKSVTKTLREFLPGVKRVKIEVSKEERTEALRRACNIIVNDGTTTNLREKGDGMQNLAALSLMRHSAIIGASGKRILLAVEEPETHLHSRAIHQLKSVLHEIASTHQVIITTHNSVFVNRDAVGTNIVVSQNEASPAKSVKQIRDTLGIRPGENLRHADLVLVVEGEDDRRALSALLAAYSSQIKAALVNGTLAIDPLNGSSNLSFKLLLLRDAFCPAFVFVDHDKAGKDPVAKAIADGVLTKADVKFALCRGKSESELEDLYALAAYEGEIKKYFSVTLVKPLMRGTKKWSERVANCFIKSGQPWDDTTKAAVKARVAETVAASPKSALNAATRGPFDALMKIIQERLTASTSAKKQ